MDSKLLTQVRRAEKALDTRISAAHGHSYCDGYEFCLIPGHESISFFGMVNDIEFEVTISGYPAGPKLNQRVPYSISVAPSLFPDQGGDYHFEGTARNWKHALRSIIRKIIRNGKY